MENIGRVHSHLEHRSILGFKALQYNILSAVKRIMDYETIGEFFKQAIQESKELTVSE